MTKNLTARTASITAGHVDTPDARVHIVTRIGAADGYALDVAEFVYLAAPVETDWSARGAVPKAIVAWIGADVAQTEERDGKRVRTTFGKGVDAVAKHLRTFVTVPASGADADAAEEGFDTTPEVIVPETPDYLALAVEAATRAVSNGVDAGALVDAIMSATGAHLV